MGPRIDSAPVPLENSTPILTQAEILSNQDWKYNKLALENTDIAKIIALYPESQDETQALQMLVTELKQNLRDEKGERTPNLAILVELGLLDERGKCSASGGWSEQLREGSRLLTPKGAALLGIDLGAFTICEEILTATAIYQAKVADLIRFRDSQLAYLAFLEQIINTEPDLQKSCPPDLELIPFLNGALGLMYSSHCLAMPLPSLVQHDETEKILIGMAKIGWMTNATLGDTRTLGELLTEKGKNRLGLYSGAWFKCEGSK